MANDFWGIAAGVGLPLLGAAFAGPVGGFVGGYIGGVIQRDGNWFDGGNLTDAFWGAAGGIGGGWGAGRIGAIASKGELKAVQVAEQNLLRAEGVAKGRQALFDTAKNKWETLDNALKNWDHVTDGERAKLFLDHGLPDPGNYYGRHVDFRGKLDALKTAEGAAQSKLDRISKVVTRRDKALTTAQQKLDETRAYWGSSKAKDSFTKDAATGKWKLQNPLIFRPLGTGSKLAQAIGAGALSSFADLGAKDSKVPDGSTPGNSSPGSSTKAPEFNLVFTGGTAASRSMGEGAFQIQQPGDKEFSSSGGFLAEPDTVHRNLRQWYGASQADSPSGSLAQTLDANWQTLAPGKKPESVKLKSIPPAPASLPQPATAAAVEGYSAKAAALRQRTALFDQLETKLAAEVGKTKDVTLTARDGITNLIRGINKFVVSAADGSDATFTDLLVQGFNEADNIIQNATDLITTTGGTVDTLTEKLKQLTDAQDQKLKDATAALQEKLDGMRNSWMPPNTNPGDYETPRSGTDPANTAPAGTGTTPGLGDAASGLPDVGSNASPAYSPGFSGGAGMGDPMSSLLPLMAMQNMRNGLGTDGDPQEPEPDRSLLDPSPLATTPPTAAQPTPWSGPTDKAAQATPWSGQGDKPDGSATSGPDGSKPGLPASARPVNPDGTVVYTFPDGRVQTVSTVVAAALDAAFGNTSGTDAKAAYAKTAAKWSDNRVIGDRVDPYQLKTGDVAMWEEDRTAMLVVFSTETSGTLEAVVNGHLTPFTTEMQDAAGGFGQFAGFVHPKGTDATSTATNAGNVDGHPGTPTDRSTGQSSPAAAPAPL